MALRNLSDEKILELYFYREESAIEATDRKYGALLRSIAKHLTGDSEEAEQCVWDGYLNAWNAIPPEKPEHLQAYLIALVRRLAISAVRKKQSEKRGAGAVEIPLYELEEILPAPHSPEQEAESNALNELVGHFVEALAPRRKALFIGRFYLGMPIRELASHLNLGVRRVHQELSAMRTELRQVLEREGYLE